METYSASMLSVVDLPSSRVHCHALAGTSYSHHALYCSGGWGYVSEYALGGRLRE